MDANVIGMIFPNDTMGGSKVTSKLQNKRQLQKKSQHQILASNGSIKLCWKVQALKIAEYKNSGTQCLAGQNSDFSTILKPYFGSTQYHYF
jgi:hypothetical protein